ncbi:NAD(P)-binding protein [Methylobacterium sp. BTF04]|nr:NAD(P)-binding protein [Methylobacterium sp. BTF04]
MAGAIAARRLTQAGLAVTVLDKGRGIGGRMATRRVADHGFAFDHGAQFMRAHGPDFAAALADWHTRGIVAPWGETGRWVGTPGMTAPVRDLLAGLDVRPGHTVTALVRKGSRWHLTVTETAVEEAFDAVAISFPTPQVIRLLDTSGLSLPGIERPTYAPCWTLMVALDGACDLPGSDLVDADGPVGTVFREDEKPGRRGSGTRLVIHATPDWSRAHLEEDAERVQTALLAALARHAGRPLTPAYARAHRWRYALLETTLGEPCLYDPALRLGVCGDGCLGPRIEAAFDSGRALAARIGADLA